MTENTVPIASASDQGYALSVGEGRKMTLHAAPCQAVGVSFVPLIVETLGGWSGLAVCSISHAGRILGQCLGIPAPESTCYLFQRCAICLWRGNATLWLNRFSSSPSIIDCHLSLCLCLLLSPFWLLCFFLLFCFFVCFSFVFFAPFSQ